MSSGETYSILPVESENLIRVSLNNGDGTFRAVGSYGSDASFTNSVAITDVNGDGKPDMVVSDLCGFANCQQRTGGTVTVRTGNGDGTFAGGDFVYGSGGDNPARYDLPM
jgi:hypothetical protein